jgi:hypothetical protein
MFPNFRARSQVFLQRRSKEKRAKDEREKIKADCEAGHGILPLLKGGAYEAKNM